jgi:hypothetical protein
LSCERPMDGIASTAAIKAMCETRIEKLLVALPE